MKSNKEQAVSSKDSRKRRRSTITRGSEAESNLAVTAKALASANLPEAFAGTNVFSLIQAVRAGVDFTSFEAFALEAPFSPAEWTQYLHLSGRTLQRYKKEGGLFDPLQSEKILEIMLLLKKGTAVFGDKENFHAWLAATSSALGNVKPKDLLDSSFGINLLQDELTRLEYGILA